MARLPHIVQGHCRQRPVILLRSDAIGIDWTLISVFCAFSIHMLPIVPYTKKVY